MLKTLTVGTALVASLAGFQPGSAEASPRHVGAGIAAGVIGAAIVGTAIAATAAPRCTIERREVFNRYGHYRGTRAVRVCY